jgi:hypothetical protein
MGIADCGLGIADWGLRIGDWRMANGEWRMANGEWRMGALACEAAEAEGGVAVVVAEDPDADGVDADVVEEVVWEAVQVATTQAGCVMMEEAGVGDGFFENRSSSDVASLAKVVG